MPYENNGTLRKWHMTNVPPKVDKYDTHKNGALQKWHTLPKNCQMLSPNGWAEWFFKVNSSISSM